MRSNPSKTMTLDDLSKPAVQIILGIREGHGFGFLNTPVIVVAGLDGHRLETDVIQPASDPTFDVELVWEAESKNIKRLKQANTPVKIECFTVCNPQKRDRIGFVLLSLRQAQIAPREKKVSIVETWHRLVGVRSDMKALNPEMLLTLTIEDSPDNMSSITEMGDFRRDGAQSGHKIGSSSLIPLLYADEGHVQIGPPDTSSEFFKFRINIGVFGNLRSLLTNGSRRQLSGGVGGGGGGGVDPDATGLSVAFCVMGYTVKTRIGPKELKDTVRSEEAKNICVRSSLPLLKAYFCENRVVFRLTNDDEVEVGSTTLHLKGLITTENLAQFDKDKGCSLDTRCYIGTSKLDCPLKPFMDISVKLTHERPISTGAQNQLINNSVGGCGDFAKQTGPQKHNFLEAEKTLIETILSPRKRLPQTMTVPSLEFEKVRESQLAMAGQQGAPACAAGNHTYRAAACDQLHSFTLRILLDSIMFRKMPADGRFVFRMHHALAEVVCSEHKETVVERSNEKVALPAIVAEFRFVSGVDEINGILLAEQPSVRVCDSAGVFAVATLHTGILLSHNNKECAYTASLENDTAAGSKVQLGLLNVTMALQDCGVLLKPSNFRGGGEGSGTDVVSTGAGFDKRVAVRVVEELEDWKERQQEIFKNELKRKECQHLAVLSSEWTKRRTELEENLNRNVEQCRTLALSLNEASDRMRERTRHSDEKERELKNAEVELERKFGMRLQELREASKRMEADVNHKLSLLTAEKTELLDRVNFMEREKRRLVRTIQTLESEIESMRCGGLTKEQIAKVLQEMKSLEEKLDSALESKAFFKAQWGKAVREIHRLKTDHQQAIQNQLQREREELQRLNSGYGDRLSQQAQDHESQLLYDRTVLQELRTETQDVFTVQQLQHQYQPQYQTQPQPPPPPPPAPPLAPNMTMPFFSGGAGGQPPNYALHAPQSKTGAAPPFGTVPNFEFSKLQVQKLLDQHKHQQQQQQLFTPGEMPSNRELLAGLNSQIRRVLSQAQTAS